MKSKMTKHYFSSALNYTLANEDARIEYELLPENVGHAMAVAGSGSRIVPLLAKNPRILSCVDLVPIQLSLTQMRIEALRKLSHRDYLGLLGYPDGSDTKPGPEERREWFESLSLTEEARKNLREVFKEIHWEPLLYLGKWENTFRKLNKVNRLLTREAGLRLFDCETIGEQRAYLQNYFPKRAWSIVLLLVANSAVFNALLYKGAFPRKNIPGSMLSFYTQNFSKLFHNTLARENFFLQLCFFGELKFHEGNPPECDPNLFAKAKAALAGVQVRYCQASIIDELKSAHEKVDFASLSNVPSYFTGDLEREFLQEIAPGLVAGARVVLRHYLHVPEANNRAGYRSLSGDYQDLFRSEKVGMYEIELLSKN